MDDTPPAENRLEHPKMERFEKAAAKKKKSLYRRIVSHAATILLWPYLWLFDQHC